ncbi:MAG: cyclic nucleotide-binding domain-containing protein [Hyphomicrobiaceae bacterium]
MSPDLLMLSLLGAPLFTGLAPLQLKVLALTAERVSFRDGEAVIRSGEEGDAAFLIVSGEVAVDLADDMVGERAVLPAGTLVGELAMLIETEHGSTVKATGSVNALRFSRQMMHELMQRYPGMAEHFTAKIRQRLEQMAEALREIDEMLDLGDDLGGESQPAERQAMH